MRWLYRGDFPLIVGAVLCWAAVIAVMGGLI